MLDAAWGALSAHAGAPRSKFREISRNLGAGSGTGACTEHASCRTGPSRVTLSKAHSYSILGHPGTIHGALHQLPTPHSSLSPNFDLMLGRTPGGATVPPTLRIGRTDRHTRSTAVDTCPKRADRAESRQRQRQRRVVKSEKMHARAGALKSARDQP